MHQTDAPDEDTMVGMFSIFSQPACVLFDTGTTLSYMFDVFANKCGVPVEPTKTSKTIKSLLGVSESISKTCSNIDIVVAGYCES